MVTTAATATTITTFAARWALRLHVAFRLLDQGLAAETEATGALVDLDQLDGQLVTGLGDRFHVLDAGPIPFGDVDQAFGARDELDEGAEVLDRGDFAFVDLALFRQLGEVGDPALGLLDRCQVWRGDGDHAVVVDGQRAAGLVLDLADGLAALADDLADELGVDLDLNDLRRVWRALRGGW